MADYYKCQNGTNPEPATPELRATSPDGGKRVILWLTDEHGCLLNTEPVCQIIADFHPWFWPWLQKAAQKNPLPPHPGLLYHPALRGEEEQSGK